MANKKISDLFTDNPFASTDIAANMVFEVYDPGGVTDADKSGATSVDSLSKGIWRLYPTTLGCVIDGGGSTITTGIKGDIIVPYACTITGYTVVADQSGSIVIDLWKDTYANHPPTNADSITDAGTSITVTGATKAQTTTLTGWTTSLSAGDILRVNVDSVTSITRVTLALNVRRTA